jgi:hypothetical protein
MASKLDSIYPRDRWSNDSNLYNNDTVYSTTRDYLAVLVTQRVFLIYRLRPPPLRGCPSVDTLMLAEDGPVDMGTLPARRAAASNRWTSHCEPPP